MTSVAYRHVLDVPLADVWAVVGDFGSLLSWVRGGSEGSISLTGDGVGMLRDLVLPSVGNVQHRLDELDEQTHRLTYSLTSGKPLGMAAYSVSLQLLPDAETDAVDRCVLDWLGEFTPESGAVLDDVAAGLEDAYRMMSELLGELLETGRT